ncbi:MAG: hypothetical protein WAZ34_01620 [Rhodocyclaceae bacterium]
MSVLRYGDIQAILRLFPVSLEGALVFFRKPIFFRAGHALSAIVLLLAGAAVHADEVVCHYTYGGETKSLAALPTASPYAVKAIPVGSFFQFRVVFQKKPASLAAIKVYTYADRDEGPLLIHQASYPYPPESRRRAPYGFSGLHFVYEPMRDGELQYWCELVQSAARRAR